MIRLYAFRRGVVVDGKECRILTNIGIKKKFYGIKDFHYLIIS